MSTERHQRAMSAWKVLEEMDEAVRLDVLADEAHDSHRAPCSGALAGMVFRRLGIDVDEWCIYYVKLYGRPVARVWKLYEAAKVAKPEQYAGLITAFGKRVPALEATE